MKILPYKEYGEWVVRAVQVHNKSYAFASLIFFVTGRCNSKCKGCFYLNKLNKKAKDLTLDEIKKVSNSIGSVWQLNISGGEPFLHKDLPEICRVFTENNSTKRIVIPTNGLRTKSIISATRRILELCKCDIRVTVSIDGTEETDYKMRGIKDWFLKAVSTLKKLNQLEKDDKRLNVFVGTRITNLNVNNIPALHKILKQLGLGKRHIMFPVRGVIDRHIRPPTSTEYAHLIDTTGKNSDALKVARTSLMRGLLDGKRWPFRCVAGKRIGVIDHDGGVRLCELLEPVGNLRDNRYDFYAVWNSKKANEQRELIKEGLCSAGCTHGCFIWYSLLNSPLKALSLIARSGKLFR